MFRDSGSYRICVMLIYDLPDHAKMYVNSLFFQLPDCLHKMKLAFSRLNTSDAENPSVFDRFSDVEKGIS